MKFIVNKRYLTTCILVWGILLISRMSFGQCALEFTCTVEDASVKAEDGKLYVSLLKGNPPFIFKLYDLYGSSEFIATKEVTVMVNGKPTLVFEKLRPSTYIIQVIQGDCKRTLGGLEGYTVHTKNTR